MGGIGLAKRCEEKLIRLEETVHRLEGLVFTDPRDEVEPLIIEARIKASHERKAREKRILEQEVIVANLCERQRHPHTKMDAYNNIAEHTGVRTAQGETTLKDFKLESARVHGAYREAMEALHALHREDATAATTKAELQKKAEEQL